MENTSKFDEAEADVDHGHSWRFREADVPNPVTIEATHWSTGVTKLGEAEWLNGVDRDGKQWSILVGGTVLKKKLLEGLVEEWNDDRQEFVVVETLGRVQPGGVVSIKFLGGCRRQRAHGRVRDPVPPGDALMGGNVEAAILRANAAIALYNQGELTDREWLNASREGLLADIDELLLDSVRSTLTIDRARQLGLLKAAA